MDSIEEGAFEGVEIIEQQLIQHLRTAGIRKPRETELINEVMLLRRERRKSYNVIKTAADYFNEENRDVREQLNNCIKERKSEILSRKDLLTHVLRNKDTEINEIKERYQTEYDKLIDKYSSMAKIQIEKISKSYEEKFQIVEGKVQELLVAKENHDEKAAEAIAVTMTDKAIYELKKEQKIEIQK